MTLDPVIQLRFDERFDTVLASDAAGGLADLDVDTAGTDTTMPAVVDAFTGPGRAFISGSGLQAVDKVPGSTLLIRDVTVQAILSWDLTAQNSAGAPGVIICRGYGDSPTEAQAFGLELRVVNAAGRVGEVRWFWQNTAGDPASFQIGGQFVAPTSGFMLLTATRRWVSSTEVEIAYYLGDHELIRLTTTDGDIGGGTTAMTTIGYRENPHVSFLCGVIDELRVVPEALIREEIAATWQRIAVIQPDTVQLFRDAHPPGFPISTEPGSDVQLENRGIGTALGYAAAQVENLRQNLLPDRAYGSVLARWEVMTGQHPKAGDSVARRRARVVAHIRQRAGFSPGAVRLALAELFGMATADIDLISFSNTIADANPFGTRRWRAYGGGAWSAQSGGARGQSTVDEDIRLTGPIRNWAQYVMALDSDGLSFDGIVKMIPTAIGDGTEVGIFAENRVTGERLLVGLRNDAAAYKVMRSRLQSNQIVFNETVIATTSLTTHWFRLAMNSDGTLANFLYSLTDGVSGFVGDSDVALTPLTPNLGYDRFGFYLRSLTNVTHPAVDVRFDEVNLRTPFGHRPFYVYAFRDPAAPGGYDLVGSSLLLRRLRQAHTHAAAIDDIDLLCDDGIAGCDLGPCGGI